MIFGFGKNRDDDDDDDDEDEDEEIDLVSFLGALNGKDANLAGNARLVDAGLIVAKELVTDGLSRRAGTIRLDPKGERASVTLIVDGVAYPGRKMVKQEALAITQMLKLLSGLDIKERTKPQAGGIKAEFETRPYELRISSTPAEGGGERLTVRVIDPAVKLDNPTDLGFTGDLKSKVREICATKGLFCVVGPPGSGTSTTLFGVLRGIDSYLYQVFTIGETGGRKLDNITAFEANAGDTLENTLQRVLRIDADVVLIDPLKDEATVKTLLQLSERASFLTEFPAKDTPSGVLQLVKWAGDSKSVAKGLNAVLTQKLIRLLCTECKQAYRPNPQFLKKAGLPSDVSVLYRKPKPPDEDDPQAEEPEICSKCAGIGYFGRTAMLELLEMTDEMRQLVAKGSEAVEIRQQMRKEKMPTLQQDGLRLVIEGRTSLEELQRVFKAP